MAWQEDGGERLGEVESPQPVGYRVGLASCARRGGEELRVRRLAARMLLPDIRKIGEALAWAHTYTEAAEELWVDLDTLLDRLDSLHPAELHYLRRRLAEDL